MRRSICICEPPFTFAGEVATWKFSYTTATNLPKGSSLKFDTLSKAKESDWEVPQVDLKNRDNLIWAEMPEGKEIKAELVKSSKEESISFLFILPSELKAGEVLNIFMGTPSKTQESIGNRAQTTTQRRRPFHLYIDPKGKKEFRDPEIFTLDVRGNKLDNIRIFTPSIVSKNRRFDLIVRFEDSFGNLTSNAPKETLIELSYEHLRENFSWKLFVPETGFINLPNLYFNDQGIYRIQLCNLHTKATFYSPPIKCFADYDKNLYWGLLHAEPERRDSTESVESLLRHFRDEQGLDFYASSVFENEEESSNENWKLLSTHIAEFNEDNRFTTFLGFQWMGGEPTEGLRQLVYLKDNKPVLRSKDSKYNVLKKIYKSHTPKEIFSVPCSTMAKPMACNLEDFTPEFERVVEIYNAWGSSECTEKEGNWRPIKAIKRGGLKEASEGSIRDALNRNCRFGFIAGGSDKRGPYQTLSLDTQEHYSPGLTAIVALEQTRETLSQALTQRACYATTGTRIILGFEIAGAPMGSELNTKTKPGLLYNRHITGYIAGTAPIQRVEIIRNGTLIHTLTPKKEEAGMEFTYDDAELLTKIALSSSDEKPPFAYYYLRVLQEDGHIAWASPIWIDIIDLKKTAGLVSVDKKPKRK